MLFQPPRFPAWGSPLRERDSCAWGASLYILRVVIKKTPELIFSNSSLTGNKQHVGPPNLTLLFLNWRRTPWGEVGPPQTLSERAQNSWNLKNQMRILWAPHFSPGPGRKQNSPTRKIIRPVSEFSTGTFHARGNVYRDLRERECNPVIL